MNKRLQFSIWTILVVTAICAVSMLVGLQFNQGYTIYEVPRPNSGTFSTAEAAALLPKSMERSAGIERQHELIQQWTGPTQSIKVHIQRDGTIRTIDFYNKEHFGFDAIQKSIDGVPRWGNAVSVLLTSDTNGWNDLQQKREVLEVLFTPGIQIYVVKGKRRILRKIFIR